ncbi:MAG TPA: aa3-type cytochrome c oxidase subunit IV [Caulobacteraceae bacterium]|nr:aa3-type cytochrome c oxidase subunit IV [Caulobacteraceae bacterium]
MATSSEEALAHATTYHRFMLGLKWVCISIATVIVMLVSWFATPAGFWGGVFIAAIVFIIAAWAMGRFLSHSTEEDDAELNAVIRGGGAT